MQILNFLRHLNRKRNYKTREFKRRATLFSMARKIDDKRAENLDVEQIKTITFPFVDLGIGDAVCHTGIWKKLKEAGYTVQILAEERKKEFFEKLDCIDKFYIVDPNNPQSSPKVKTDLVISIYSWMKRKELFNTKLLSNIEYKYAISFGGWLTKPYNVTIPLQKDFHITVPQKAVLDLLNVDSDNFGYALPQLSHHDTFINEYISKINGKQLVIINPFASVEERSLTPTQLASLASRLSKNENIQTFIIGEKDKLNKINICDDNVSICTFDSLWDAVSLMRKADLIISVDTSVVHIACALRKKLIGIYYSVYLDHNETLKGNIIFAPQGENAKQLIFDKKSNPINIDTIYTQSVSFLKESA